MKTKSRKGFTITELAIAIATSTIVLLAIGVVVVGGQIFWNEAWERVNLQRDASYAMLLMNQSIKEAANVKVDANDKSLTVTDTAGGTTKFGWNSGLNTLRCWVGTGPPFTVVDNVQNLQFVADANGTVTINLGLKEDDVQTYFVSTVMMRN